MFILVLLIEQDLKIVILGLMVSCQRNWKTEIIECELHWELKSEWLLRFVLFCNRLQIGALMKANNLFRTSFPMVDIPMPSTFLSEWWQKTTKRLKFPLPS